MGHIVWWYLNLPLGYPTEGNSLLSACAAISEAAAAVHALLDALESIAFKNTA